MNIFKLLSYLPDLNALFALWADVQAIAKTFNEANIDKLIFDVKPLVKKYAPNIPDAELDAIAGDLVALASILSNQSTATIGAALAVIVRSAPEFGLKTNPEKETAFISAGVEWLAADFGVK